MPTLIDKLTETPGLTVPMRELLRDVILELCGHISDSNIYEDVVIWQDNAARAVVQPARAGVLGVQLSDQTIWIANSNVAGDWREYALPWRGGVTLSQAGVTDLYFPPDADTDASRWLALVEALTAAQATPSVRTTLSLGRGGYLVPAGARMATTNFAQNSTVVFQPGSIIRYTDPNDTKFDSAFFSGIRNPVHFGAFPDIGFTNTPFADSWPAFQSAKFSLPPVDGASVDEFGELVRVGTVEIPDGKYTMSQPFTSQAGQTWRGSGGRNLLRWADNIATLAGSVVRWAWTVARTNVTGLGPLANFTHDVNISGLVFDRGTGNELLGGINFSGAQGSSLSLITIVGFGAGVFCQPYTSNVDFTRIDINLTTGRVGAGFEMDLGNTNLLRSISVVRHNFDGLSADPDDTRYSAAIKLTGCRANTFLNVLAENCPRTLMMDSCEANVFNTIEASAPDLANTCLLDTTSGGQNVFHSLRGFDMDVMVRVSNVTVEAGLNMAWANTNFAQDISTVQTLKADRVLLPSASAMLDFARATGPAGAQIFRWKAAQGDGNPALTLTVSSTDGTSPTEVFNIAKNNGGASSGYQFIVTNVYALESINTLEDYYVDGVKVVGNQGAAVADVAASSAAGVNAAGDPPTGAEFNALVAQFNALVASYNALQASHNTVLTRARTHGLIAT